MFGREGLLLAPFSLGAFPPSSEGFGELQVGLEELSLSLSPLQKEEITSMIHQLR